MPKTRDWEGTIRTVVSHALSQRGCLRGWSVLNHRGHVRLNIAAGAGGGTRQQVLLPVPWQADQVDAIKDAVVFIYEAFENKVPLEFAVAELNAAKALQIGVLQEESITNTPSSLQLNALAPQTISQTTVIDWAGLICNYKEHKLRSGEIKETTWNRLYKPRMALLLKTAKGPPAPRDATQLLEAQADQWSQRPGCRTRTLQIQYVAALLRWAFSQKYIQSQWTSPSDLSTFIGRSREIRAVTTPIAAEDIKTMVEAIQDQRWRYAFKLLSAYGLRPEELQHLQLREGRLWCTYEKIASRGKTKPRPLRILPCDQWADEWNLAKTFEQEKLPPMRAGFGSDSISRYLLRKRHWQDLRQKYEAQGEKLVLYSCRHGYAHRAHVLCDLPPKVVAAAMGHSVQTHLSAYSRWCGDDVVDDAFIKAAKRIEAKQISSD